MKVICISPITQIDPKTVNRSHPEVGDIDTVDEVVDRYGQKYYGLARFDKSYFRAALFSPLSGIDELELVNEKELVNG